MFTLFSRRKLVHLALVLVILAGLSFSFRSRPTAAQDQSDLPELVYIYPGGQQEDLEMVEDALSEYMAERIGATIDLRPVDWGAYNDQLSLMNASGEEYDIAFTASWINNYYANISQENFIPLEDLLVENAPGYWASMTPETWEAARVGGSIYGAINQQIFVKPFGPYIRTDVLQAIGMEDEFANITSYADLEPILAAIKDYADEDEVLTHVAYNLAPLLVAENWGYDPMGTGLVVDIDDPTAQVQIYSETPEYREAVQMIRRWYEAGYVPSDPALWDEIDAAWTAGLFAVRVSDIVKPGGNAEVEARWGWPVTSKALAEPVLTTSSVTATMNGVSYTSEHPDLVVKFFELLNTDPVFYNMLAHGIEGEHWEWADEEAQLIRPANGAESFDATGYNPNTGWMFGNTFNAYYTDPTQVGAWEATAELNRSARPSPLLGFTFDPSEVETEVASVTAVIQEYNDPLGSGQVEDVETGIATLNQALKDAGIERIRDEMQRQIEEWQAQNS